MRFCDHVEAREFCHAPLPLLPAASTRFRHTSDSGSLHVAAVGAIDTAAMALFCKGP
jgi:hypothetical protein